ncbi:MAG: aminoacyl-tRNA hydrolase [Pseudomonadota bacterium]
MFLLVGLGNPGSKYAGNRHNAGFMAVDAIAEDHGFPPFRSKFQAQTAEGRIGSERAVILKPQTYYNESGRAVQEAARFYKINPGAIFVFHDEIDLAPGKVRVKKGGGLAGNNGLKSIAAHLSPDVWRVRIGVGHPGSKDAVTHHVLKDFAKDEREGWFGDLLRAIGPAMTRLLPPTEENASRFMSALVQPAKLQNNQAKSEPALEARQPSESPKQPSPSALGAALGSLFPKNSDK